MALEGLKMRHALCKICSSFKDDAVLNEITLDILLHRKTYREIKEFYNPKLPPGVKGLNDININNHRKHCDPYNLAKRALKDYGEPGTEAEVVSQLYGERFKAGLDSIKVLKEIYKERIANLEHLQALLKQHRDHLEVLTEELAGWKETDEASLKHRVNLRIGIADTQGIIRRLTLDIDAIQNDMQHVLLKDISVEKGISGGNITIVQNYVVLIQDKLKGFMNEIVPYLLTDVFANNSELGKRVVSNLGHALDKHLSTVIDEQLLLKELKK